MKKLHAWLRAFRLRTLPLAFSSLLMGGFLAASRGYFDASILVWSLVTTLLLQVLSNLANDYGDYTSGVDGDHRQGPARTVQAGLIPASQMKRALVVFSILSLCSGMVLLWVAFRDQWLYALLFLVVGLGAIYAAIRYTVGKKPYGYAGLGDVAVLLFFGLTGVGGSYFLYAKSLDGPVWLLAVSCGLFAVGVLNVNNIRDIASDEASGKRSLPVRMGRSRAVAYHAALLTTGFLLAVIFALGRFGSVYGWAFVLVAPLLIRNFRAVRSKRGMELDPYLKQLALTTLLFVLLMGAGLLWA